MKDIIKKILKENEDEFEWAHDSSADDLENDIKYHFKEIEEYGFEGEDLYNMIIDAGALSLMKIKSIGEFVHEQIEAVHDRSYQRGRDDGYDDCSCDGCCDDYVWYETHDREVEEAKEEGIEEGRAESDSKIGDLLVEIEDLQIEIAELKERIEELENE